MRYVRLAPRASRLTLAVANGHGRIPPFPAAAPGRRCSLPDEPMHRHTTWRTGGPAQRAYFPSDLQDLARFLRSLPAAEPVQFVGLGSNLLVRDGGVRGTSCSPTVH